MAEARSFGEWLRRRRLALGITQSALAQRIGCSAIALRKIEADERRPSGQIAIRLAQHLALPEELQRRFVACARGAIAADRLPLPESLAPTQLSQWQLPAPPNPLIGRQAELATLQQQIAAGTRLITLVGPPGIGKSRLALALAMACADTFADGAAFVPLATLTTAEQVLPAIAQALGVPENTGVALDDALGWFCRSRQLLLLLDNFEQVRDAAPFVGRLLAAAPTLVVVATSRAPLQIAGEQIYDLLPLTLPQATMTSAVAIDASAAVQLFCERARAARAGFALTDTNAASVAGIVRRLDGLPLAIELAAARVRRFSPQVLLARLEESGLHELRDGPRDLPARQQTLYNCIDWSYALLSPAAQAAFRRLGVCVGGFTPAAAAAICATPVDELLAELFDQSLLVRRDDEGDELRYGMLELIRTFALAQLPEAGEEVVTRRRHAHYFAAFAEAGKPQLYDRRQLDWLNALEREHANLQAAINWSLAADSEDLDDALRIVVAIWEFWQYRHFNNAISWLEPVHAALQGRATDLLLAAFLNAFGKALWAQANHVLARDYLDQALAIVQRYDDRLLEAEILNHLGEADRRTGNLDQARARFERSLALSREVGDENRAGWALYNLGVMAMHHHDHAAAEGWFNQSLKSFVALGNRWGQANVTSELALVADERGSYAAADDRYRRMGELFADIDPIGTTFAFYLRGDLARRHGELSSAERFAAVGAEAFAAIGHVGGQMAILSLQTWIAYDRGDQQDAAVYCQQMWQLVSATNNMYALSDLILLTASIAVACGEHRRAAELLGYGAAHRERHEIVIAHDLPQWIELHERSITLCRAALGEEVFAAAWELGRAASFDLLATTIDALA